jgi:predicted permease
MLSHSPGSVIATVEAGATAQQGEFMTSFRHDLSYSIRMLKRTPGFTAAAILLLGLGIGVNTLLFSAVQTLVANPLSVGDADRLVDVFTTEAGQEGDVFPTSEQNFEDLQRESRTVFSGLAGYVPAGFVVSGRERSERLNGYLVTANYFDVLGILPSLGRAFAPGEDRIGGGADVAVLSYAFWQRRFGGDPAAVGRTLLLDGAPYTIVGVAPRGFRGTVTLVSPEQIFVPLSSYDRVLRGAPRAFFLNRRALFLRAFGRLKSGVSTEAAEAAVGTVARRLEAEYPDANRGRGITLSPLTASAIGTDSVMAPRESRRARHGSAAVLAASAAVLLIAAANLSSLLLLRFARRSRETSIRAALGADSKRLFSQPLVESTLLCAMGALAGWALAAEGRLVLLRFAPPFVPKGVLEAAPDWRAFAFGFGAAAVVSVLIAALPAFRASVASPAEALAVGGRSGTALGPRERQATRVFVTAELALATVALIGSGLFLRALGRAEGVDPGIRTRGLAYFSLDLGAAGYQGIRAQALAREIVRTVRSLPGSTGAGVSTLPPVGGGPQRTVLREGTEDDPANVAPVVTVNAVSPGYLAAAGVRLLRGRDVTASDGAAAPPVAVVNEAFAARHWPGLDAIGRRFRIFGGPEGVQVVGIVHNTLVARLDERPQPVAYLPLAQADIEIVTVTASTNGGSENFLAAMKRRVAEIDAGLAPFDALTVESALARGLWAPRAMASLLLLFGALAIALAAVGLYGLVAQSVTQRLPEIGIRMALGATPAALRGLVLREAARLTTIGAPAGLLLAAALSRSLGGVLYGLPPLDPVTFLCVPALLAAATAAACLVPAHRAISVDLQSVLR